MPPETGHHSASSVETVSLVSKMTFAFEDANYFRSIVFPAEGLTSSAFDCNYVNFQVEVDV